jgi:phenylacetate-CoA ligase
MIGEFLELRQLLKNRKLSRDELEALQNRKLRAVIQHAYENITYYNTLFGSAGLSPNDIRTVDDLNYIPLTNKDDLRNAGLERIIANDVNPPSCIKTNTSGSSGKPFIIYVSQEEDRIRRLVLFRSLLSVGLKPWDRFAVLGSQEPHKTRFHQRLGLYRSAKISRFLSVEDQILLLQKIQPSVLWVYPTVLRALLHKIDYRLSKIVRPRILIAVGEVLDEVMKNRIIADLDVEIFNLYGATEVGIIAAECQTHEGLHINVDHLILESLEDHQPPESVKSGFAVLTSLNVSTMPFIRYRLGDICTFIDNTCSCGSSLPLMSTPQGREADVVRLPSGRVLSPLPFQSILQNISKIDQFRIIQEDYDQFVLQIVFKEIPKQELIQKIQSQYMTYLDEPVKFDIQIVDFIQEEKLKFGTFISRLNKSDI